MSSPLTSRELVDRLDARHDELIARLDELNAQIEAALAEFGRSRETADASHGAKSRAAPPEATGAKRREQGATEAAFPVPDTLS